MSSNGIWVKLSEEIKDATGRPMVMIGPAYYDQEFALIVMEQIGRLGLESSRPKAADNG